MNSTIRTKNCNSMTAEMAKQMRTLAALQDSGSTPSTHIVAPHPQSDSELSITPSSGLCGQQVHVMYRHTCKQSSQTHKVKMISKIV